MKSTEFFLGNKGYKIIDFLKIAEINDLLAKISLQVNKSINKKEFNKKNIKYFHKKNISDTNYLKIINPKNRKIRLNIKTFNKQISRKSKTSVNKIPC